jgi:putative transcriptional regulator
MVRRAALARYSPLACLLACLLASAAAAQVGPANGILLVAKPGLSDPRFRETVVLVTQAQDASTVGVILNRPAGEKLALLVPDSPLAQRYEEPMYIGGPVMGRTIVALYRSEVPPEGAAFRVHKNAYLTMHPALIEPLLALPGSRFRLYAGFSGWAPRQLQSELGRADWYVLPATEELLFRKNTEGMWHELVERARSKRAALYSPS